MEEIIIRVTAHTAVILGVDDEGDAMPDEQGYMYNVYTNADDMLADETLEGGEESGYCSGTMQDAVAMGQAAAQSLLRKVELAQANLNAK